MLNITCECIASPHALAPYKFPVIIILLGITESKAQRYVVNQLAYIHTIKRVIQTKKKLKCHVVYIKEYIFTQCWLASYM